MFRASPQQRLILHRSERPGLKRLGWQLESSGQLAFLGATLGRLGVQSVDTATIDGHPCLRLAEPNTGAVLDFFAGPPSAEAAGSGGPIELLGHAVLSTPRYAQAVAFLKKVLNFRVSDEIDGRITFLRCFPNPLHHSLGIAASTRNMLHHLSFLVRRREDIDTAVDRLGRSAVPVLGRPSRHVPSGSSYLYFLDPDGLTLEYSHGMEQISERAPRAPRVLPPTPASADLDTSPRDPRTFAVGEIETERCQPARIAMDGPP